MTDYATWIRVRSEKSNRRIKWWDNFHYLKVQRSLTTMLTLRKSGVSLSLPENPTRHSVLLELVWTAWSKPSTTLFRIEEKGSDTSFFASRRVLVMSRIPSDLNSELINPEMVNRPHLFFLCRRKKFFLSLVFSLYNYKNVKTCLYFPDNQQRQVEETKKNVYRQKRWPRKLSLLANN